MGPRFGPKALAILRCAEARSNGDFDLARDLFRDANARFTEKAVAVKAEELVSRGYMECGVSARTGWLTEKGRAALASSVAAT
jgi:hypothetical protein